MQLVVSRDRSGVAVDARIQAENPGYSQFRPVLCRGRDPAVELSPHHGVGRGCASKPVPAGAAAGAPPATTRVRGVVPGGGVAAAAGEAAATCTSNLART